MTASNVVQILFYFAVLVALGLPLGRYMAKVYQGEKTWMDRVCGPVERLFYRLASVEPAEDMSWKRYAVSVLVFSLFGTLLLYVIQRAQAALPLNPNGLAAVTPEVSFNTAVSFATNTNWQAYGGETTMSHLTQMLGLTVQNFVSAAAGMAVLVALIRGLTGRLANGVGNFWVDLTRTTLYILLPISILFALLLVSQGVVQTFDGAVTVPLLDPAGEVTRQTLAVGPVASQVAIKQLGTNGGGYFNVNSAHPFENPTQVSNLLESLAILLIPCALCFTFGAMVKDKRQGRALLVAMLVILVPLTVGVVAAEQAGTPQLVADGADIAATPLQPGGNMEGKEARFGIAQSGLWAAATTAASNGSVNSMHDSYTPLGGAVPMWLMQLGEIVFGGVGSGLYGMLMYAIIAVFIAGLMVGRTPEYMGKKIEAFEMKMASLVILFPAACVLVFTAIAAAGPWGTSTLNNPGAHGFSEILYAYSSGGNNNGSAFAGLGAAGLFYSSTLGIAMWIGRFWVMIPVLAIAGSLARKKIVPASPGTLPTHTPLFIALLVGTILLVGALTFIPALALGPIVEHLQMTANTP